MDEVAPARAALRRWVREGQAPAALEAIPPTALVAAAREQGLAGLLYADLARHGAGWPDPTRRELHDVQLAWLCRGVRQLDCAARVQSMLEDRGLRSLPLKGAAVVERWYASPAERPMDDVDLLVLDDWRAARDVLIGAGFAPLARADHAWALRDPESQVVVELHRGVTSCPELHPLDAEGLWSRSVAGAGQVPRLTAAEDVLVHLGLHAAFQHGLVLSLVQYLDFRRVMEAGLDCALVLDIAARMQALPSLHAALATARSVVGAAPLDASGGPASAAPCASPLEWLVPSRPRLARVRWQLCRGRRARLVWHTLRAVDDEAPGPHRVLRMARGVLGMARRALRLARRSIEDLARLPAGPSGAAGDETISTAVHEEALGEAVLQLCLRDFDQVRLRVTGECMRPALEPGRTVILVSAARRAPRWGDVVLVRQPEGLRLHRLVLRLPLRFSRAWRSKADRATAWDAPVERSALLATVVELEGAGRRSPRARWKATGSLLRAVWTSLLVRTAPGLAR